MPVEKYEVSKTKEETEFANKSSRKRRQDKTKISEAVAEVLKTPMSGPNVYVRPEFLKELRNALKMPQYALAQVIGCTNISIHVWEKKGITDTKGSGLATFKSLVALLKYSLRFPDKIDPEELCTIVKTGSERTLIDRFLTRADSVEPDVLSSINQGTLHGILLAVLVEVVENGGRLPPRAESDFQEPFEPINE
jgi:DNA-binding transcriptional regulator YiaG